MSASSETSWKTSENRVVHHIVCRNHMIFVWYIGIFIHKYTQFSDRPMSLHISMKWWSNLAFSILFSGRILNPYEISMLDG